MTANAIVQRLRGLATRARDFPSPRVQRLLLIIAVPALAVGGVASYRSLDLHLATVRWSSLAIVAVLGGPVAGIVSAWEYQTSARINGHRLRLLAALRVTTIASVLNLLPGHGGALLRVQHLRRMGSRYSHAATVTLLLGFAWLGLAAVGAGALLLASTPGPAAISFLVLGAGALTLAGLLLRAVPGAAGALTRWGGLVLLVESCSIVVATARLGFVLHALQVPTGLSAPAVLALAGIIASVSGVLRSGLGLRELLAGTFGPLVGLTVAVGFLASAVDRLAGLVGRIPLALLLYHSAPEDEEPPGEPPGAPGAPETEGNGAAIIREPA